MTILTEELAIKYSIEMWQMMPINTDEKLIYYNELKSKYNIKDNDKLSLSCFLCDYTYVNMPTECQDCKVCPMYNKWGNGNKIVKECGYRNSIYKKWIIEDDKIKYCNKIVDKLKSIKEC